MVTSLARRLVVAAFFVSTEEGFELVIASLEQVR